jgi:RNA polymerase sigma factor (TIGR02999 family)
MPDISELIRRVNANEPGAQDALFAGAYDELRQLARSRLRGQQRDGSLNTTALVHESYLRVVAGSGELRASDRRAFFAYASSVMRSVIVDTVRARRAECRGGAEEHVTLSTVLLEGLGNDLAAEEQVLRVHEALQALAEAEPRLAQVVEMRYFGGWTEAEIGDALEITERTVRRDWDKARMLLSALLAA